MKNEKIFTFSCVYFVYAGIWKAGGRLRKHPRLDSSGKYSFLNEQENSNATDSTNEEDETIAEEIKEALRKNEETLTQLSMKDKDFFDTLVHKVKFVMENGTKNDQAFVKVDAPSRLEARLLTIKFKDYFQKLYHLSESSVYL